MSLCQGKQTGGGYGEDGKPRPGKIRKTKMGGTRRQRRTGLLNTQFENNYFTEMCSGSEAGSYLRLIDFVCHSAPGLRVMKKQKNSHGLAPRR